MLENITAPTDYPPAETTELADSLRVPKGLDAAAITSLAYDLVTYSDYEGVASTYGLSMDELAHKIKTNRHLRRAIAEVKAFMAENGGFETAVLTVVSEGLPKQLQDIKDPTTSTSERSNIMRNLMGYLTTREKNRTDRIKAKGAGDNPAGQAVNIAFNVASPIRGITTSAQTLPTTIEDHT